MKELRVPTVSREARIHYRQDDQLLVGKIFLPEFSERHEGRMRVDEWMNRPGNFFPFRADGDGKTRILNKHYVVVMTVQPQEDTDVVIGVERRESIECGDLRLEGTVSIDMPDHLSRTLDWANTADRFLLLRNAEGLHIVQKDSITMISDAGEE